VEEPIEVHAPWSRDEIVAELRRVGRLCDAFWAAFPTPEFVAPIGSAWSPADNVRHLVKSARPVIAALRIPRLGLRMAFGRATRPSRTYEDLRRDYRATLAAGGDAGRFAPRPMRLPSDPELFRERLLHRRAVTEAALAAGANRWRDGDLDLYRLPHPLLSRLTVREMLFFTLYHGVHHAANVAGRKGLWT